MKRKHSNRYPVQAKRTDQKGIVCSHLFANGSCRRNLPTAGWLSRRLLPAALAAVLAVLAPAAEFLPVTIPSPGLSAGQDLQNLTGLRIAQAAPESWYLNDYEIYQSQTLEEVNAAYQALRQAELSGENTPEQDMLEAANFLRRLSALPPLTQMPSADPFGTLAGPERKGYSPIGSVLRMPGEGYTPGKWLNYERLGRDFLSYQIEEVRFTFSEDPDGLTGGSYLIRDPKHAEEGDPEETGESDQETETEEETESESQTEEEPIPIVPLPFYPYPSAGYFPANLISARTTAWSVELNSDFIKAPEFTDRSRIQVSIRDMVTGDTYTRSTDDGTLELHTSLTGSRVLMFTPPESSIFGSNYGDLAGFRVTVKGLSDPDGAPIRSLEWQTIFFQPKNEQKLHLLSVEPEQDQVRFTEGSIAPENLKLFTDFLPTSALCTSRESAFLVPLGSWEADAEDFTWRTHPNLAAFSSSPIYGSLDNPNMLKHRISLPFTFSEDLPHLSVTTTRIARGEDFYFILSPADTDANYRLYQIRESDGKPALSLRASRTYPKDGIVTFPMPKMEHDHKGIYFALISEQNRLTFSNFIFLDPDENLSAPVTLPEGLTAMGLAKESDFRSKVFENYVPEPESEEESPETTREEPAKGREERPKQEDDLPLFESFYQKTVSWMSHHKKILIGAVGVLVLLTVIMTLLQMREQRTYRDPSSIKIRKKKPPKKPVQEPQTGEKTAEKNADLPVEDLDQ